MTKSDLIQKVHAEQGRSSGIPPEDTTQAINLILGFLSDCLAGGQRVEIRGFGTLYTKIIPGKIGRNPRTGESVDVPPKVFPRFKAGKELREMVDAKNTD